MMEGAVEADPVSTAAQWRSSVSRKLQQVLDRWTPFPMWRWLGTLVAASIYGIRVYYLEGFYVITYALGIYLLNLLIGFLSPQVDPEYEGPVLPHIVKESDEFRPFMRRLPEFKCWYGLTRAIGIAFVMTFFPIFDVPVFWPILVIYWVVLLFLTMKRQILHMVKHRYIPFSIGKQRYSGRASSSDKASTSTD
ncbi:hypothetical protein SELMODRAFT_438307 [Selaginella moellendorffii]|uniref:Protein RER1 n=1 Tax=Selaginella moellendorffii TaxID=88036 RepID=D8QVX9_SELML|nr:protein RER1A isoform X2 [Selaginella moellendorffii]EFJ18680.1 hypothetical protein SELMODRAFT_419939 [Selaginella moellendorffii]EFJ36137.1 hypothetical protein SELMODRAFT_438307 [Selaginella moellendorffii]|eukprot:XP_002962674.1 protein RER1A isoform X2 [Selaginella moellendorffii]